jgi:uncharacterized protein (DUF169 family)
MKDTIENYKDAGKELFNKLHLPTYPIAVKFIKTIEEIPKDAGIRRPVEEGIKMSICQCLSKTRKLGESWCLTAVDNFCTPMTVGMGWVKGITEEELVESQIKQKWHKDPDAEKKVFEDTLEYESSDSSFSGARKQAEQMLKLQNLGNIGFMTAPLHETPFIPDVITVYGTPVHVTYIIDALAFEKKRKYEIKTTFVGFGECTKGTLYPHLMQKPHIIVPGNGDRSYGGIQDYEIGIGLPAKHIFYVLKNLLNTDQNKGLELPLRQYLPSVDEKITPGYIYMREIIDRKLKEQQEQKLIELQQEGGK